MPRENFEAKARRYLIEGRLRIIHVMGDVVVAQCRGDSAELYRVGFGGGTWWCDCPARSRCCHIQALMLVTLRPATRLSDGVSACDTVPQAL